MFYILKTIKKGTPSISFTPFSEPTPKLTDKEIIFLPAMLIIEDPFKRFSASTYSTNLSP